MFGIPVVDLVVIAAYFLVLIALGVIAMFRIKNQEDFFLAGRRFGRFFQIFTSFGQATSTENAVGAVTTTYRDGAGGIWSQLILLWATPFYWFTARWYRRMRTLTMGDFFKERYRSPRMAMVYSAVASFYLVLIIAVSLKAVGVTVLGITLKPESELTPVEQAEYAQAQRLDELNQRMIVSELLPAEFDELEALRLARPSREFSYIHENILIWMVVLVVLIYGSIGGLEGAVWSDAVQSGLILVLSFLLIPFGMIKLNVLHGTSGILDVGRIMHQELPSYYFSPFGSPQSANFTWYFIVVLSIMATFNVAVQANQLTANASARDELTAGIGFTTGTLMKRFLTVVWGFMALLCFALYGREIHNSDLVWGHATRDLLGGLGIGLVGLMIACLLAALQSTASTLMLSSAALLTNNVYAPLVPGRSERHYILAGRVSGALFLIAAALLCTAFNTILEMLKFMWEFNAVVAASFWCGLKWRRATRQGAWASILTALTMFIILPLGLPLAFPGMRTNPALHARTQERVIDHAYTATARDVEERTRIIEAWTRTGAPPPALEVGDSIDQPVIVPPHSIYWAQGIETVGGVPRGSGLFLIEMWLLDHIFDVSANPYALNETIRYIYKILLPFLVLIIVSRLTPRDDSQAVQRFFLKMRTLVRVDRAEDEHALQAAYADPEGTRPKLLFPNSNLEFFKWNKIDTLGFILAFGVAFAVVGLLWLVLNFGAG